MGWSRSESTLREEHVCVGAGEGWQRLCVELGVKISRVERVAVTHLDPSAVGGVPGYCLTAADAGVTKIRLCGPPGLRGFVDATRHFMHSTTGARRKDFKKRRRTTVTTRGTFRPLKERETTKTKHT